MLVAVKIIVALSILWAATALVVQVVTAWGGGRKDYSERSGSPGRGIAYSFTVAMMPGHKETVKRHPVKFAVGLVMHAGVILSLLAAVLLLVWPGVGAKTVSFIRPLTALSLLAGIYLLVRRVFSVDLRAMSAPDDYAAILTTCGLLAFAILCPDDAAGQVAFLIYAALFLVYVPLGKLRHAVFFFLARGDYGRRLGYRGVYPPATGGSE